MGGESVSTTGRLERQGPCRHSLKDDGLAQWVQRCVSCIVELVILHVIGRVYMHSDSFIFWDHAHLARDFASWQSLVHSPRPERVEVYL